MAWKQVDVGASIKGREEVVFGPQFFKPEGAKKGKWKTTWIRILPVREDHPDEKFYLWTRVHFGVGSNSRQVACAAFFDRRCLVCEHQTQLAEVGRKEEAARMRAQTRAVMNVIEINEDSIAATDDDTEPTIKVWSIGTKTFDKLTGVLQGLKKKDRDIFDPEKGRDVRVMRTGTGQEDTDYQISVASEASVFNGGEYAILDNLLDLTAVYPLLEMERVAGLLSAAQHPFEEGGVEDGDVRPSRPVPETAPRQRERAVIDAEYQEVKDDDDDEEDDQRPPSTRPRTAKAPKTPAVPQEALERLHAQLRKSVRAESEEPVEEEE